MTAVLVAGVGNIFRGDDAVGSEVARRLAAEPLPDGVRVLDIGIRSLHLGYELLDGCDLFVLVDAASRGAEPGTVHVCEPELPERDAAVSGTPLLDAHSWQPDSVLELLATLARRPGRVVVVGIEPADVGDRMGLSPPVATAVDDAVRVVRDLLTAHLEGTAHLKRTAHLEGGRG